MSKCPNEGRPCFCTGACKEKPKDKTLEQLYKEICMTPQPETKDKQKVMESEMTPCHHKWSEWLDTIFPLIARQCGKCGEMQYSKHIYIVNEKGEGFPVEKPMDDE